MKSAVLSHHTGQATRLAPRRLDLALEIAARGISLIAGPHVGPGAAAVLALARLLARLAGRIGRQVEVAVVAAEAIDRNLHRTGPRLDQARALDAGDAAGVLDALGHVALEPAH